MLAGLYRFPLTSADLHDLHWPQLTSTAPCRLLLRVVRFLGFERTATKTGAGGSRGSADTKEIYQCNVPMGAVITSGRLRSRYRSGFGRLSPGTAGYRCPAGYRWLQVPGRLLMVTGAQPPVAGGYHWLPLSVLVAAGCRDVVVAAAAVTVVVVAVAGPSVCTCTSARPCSPAGGGGCRLQAARRPPIGGRAMSDAAWVPLDDVTRRGVTWCRVAQRRRQLRSAGGTAPDVTAGGGGTRDRYRLLYRLRRVVDL